MITHTITGLELAWTIVALVGLVFTSKLCMRAKGDLDFVMKYNINGLRRYAAFTTLLIFLGGMATQAAFMGVGIVAMTQPSVYHRITLANYMTASILMTGSVIDTIFAGWIYERRQHLLTILTERENGVSTE